MHFSLFLQPDGAEIDAWLRKSGHIDRAAYQAVVLADISEQDYTERFASRSPLAPETVIGIINKMAEFGPAVIVVDIDTSASEYQKAQSKLIRGAGVPPIVWSRSAYELRSTESGLFRVPPRMRRLKNVLGASEVDPKVRTGLDLIAEDDDGIVRRHYAFLRTQAARNANVVVNDSLAAAALKAFCSGANYFRESCSQILDRPRDPFAPPRIVQFAPAPAFDRITVGHLLSNAVPAHALRGKIVLLGGSFEEARDLHMTPLKCADYSVREPDQLEVDTCSGMEIWAQIIAAELASRTFTQREPWVMIGCELLALFLLFIFDTQLELFIFNSRLKGRGHAVHIISLLVSVFAGAWVLSQIAFFPLLGFASWAGMQPFLITLSGVFVGANFDKALKSSPHLAGQ